MGVTPPPPLPREHGAWTILVIPMLLGLAAVLGMAATSFFALPPWWWIAFVPVAVRTVWGLAMPPGNVRQVGLREAWVAASFTLLACRCAALTRLR